MADKVITLIIREDNFEKLIQKNGVGGVSLTPSFDGEVQGEAYRLKFNKRFFGENLLTPHRNPELVEFDITKMVD